jgi:hypothetical protein
VEDGEAMKPKVGDTVRFTPSGDDRIVTQAEQFAFAFELEGFKVWVNYRDVPDLEVVPTDTYGLGAVVKADVEGRRFTITKCIPNSVNDAERWYTFEHSWRGWLAFDEFSNIEALSEGYHA